MRLAQHFQHLWPCADKADLPAGEREDLARRADLDGPPLEGRLVQHRDMAAAIENHMFPHLVGDDGRAEFRAEPAEQGHVLSRNHNARGVERIVEQHGLGACGEKSLRQGHLRSNRQ